MTAQKNLAKELTKAKVKKVLSKETKLLPPVMNFESTEEHRISLPGIEISITHSLKLIVMVDQTGVGDHTALDALQFYLEGLGYFLHCIVVTPPTETSASE